MRNTVIFCMSGVVIGATIIFLTHSIWHQVEEIERTERAGEGVEYISPSSKAPQHNRELASSKSAEGIEAAITDESPNKEPAGAKSISETETFTNTHDVSRVDQYRREIPAAYVAMLTPRPLPERLTTQEMYKQFVTESRDEAWAYPMELGIEQYVQEKGGEFSAAIEFIECRSRYCTVAGVVYGGSQTIVNDFMVEMTQRGWWQTFGGKLTVSSSSSTDNEFRFVSIFPRTPDDFLRKESSGQSIDKNQESGLKSVGG